MKICVHDGLALVFKNFIHFFGTYEICVTQFWKIEDIQENTQQKMSSPEHFRVPD